MAIPTGYWTTGFWTDGYWTLGYWPLGGAIVTTQDLSFNVSVEGRLAATPVIVDRGLGGDAPRAGRRLKSDPIIVSN